jgi:hypothetical protein
MGPKAPPFGWPAPIEPLRAGPQALGSKQKNENQDQLGRIDDDQAELIQIFQRLNGEHHFFVHVPIGHTARQGDGYKDQANGGHMVDGRVSNLIILVPHGVGEITSEHGKR